MKKETEKYIMFFGLDETTPPVLFNTYEEAKARAQRILLESDDFGDVDDEIIISKIISKFTIQSSVKEEKYD